MRTLLLDPRLFGFLCLSGDAAFIVRAWMAIGTPPADVATMYMDAIERGGLIAAKTFDVEMTAAGFNPPEDAIWGLNPGARALFFQSLFFMQAGHIIMTLGSPELALSLFERAVSIRETFMDANTPHFAGSLMELAACHESISHPLSIQRAVDLVERAVAIFESTLIKKDRNELVRPLCALANLRRCQGRLDDAQMVLDRCVGILGLGVNYTPRDLVSHPHGAQIANQLASLHSDLGALDKALSLQHALLAHAEKLFGRESPPIVGHLETLSTLYSRKRLYAHALPLARRALDINIRTFSAEHKMVAMTMRTLGIIYIGLLEPDTALGLLHGSLAMFEKLVGPDHLFVIQLLQDIGGYLAEVGRSASALPYAVRAADTALRVFGEKNVTTYGALSLLGMVMVRHGNAAAALEPLSKALEGFRVMYGPKHPPVVSVLTELGKAQVLLGMAAEGRESFRNALELACQVIGPDSCEALTATSMMAAVVADGGDHDKAAVMLSGAVDLAARAFGRAHPMTLDMLIKLCGIHVAGGYGWEALAAAEMAVEYASARAEANHAIVAALSLMHCLAFQTCRRPLDVETTATAAIEVARSMPLSFGSDSKHLLGLRLLRAIARCDAFKFRDALVDCNFFFESVRSMAGIENMEDYTMALWITARVLEGMGRHRRAVTVACTAHEIALPRQSTRAQAPKAMYTATFGHVITAYIRVSLGGKTYSDTIEDDATEGNFAIDDAVPVPAEEAAPSGSAMSLLLDAPLSALSLARNLLLGAYAAIVKHDSADMDAGVAVRSMQGWCQETMASLALTTALCARQYIAAGSAPESTNVAESSCVVLASVCRAENAVERLFVEGIVGEQDVAHVLHVCATALVELTAAGQAACVAGVLRARDKVAAVHQWPLFLQCMAAVDAGAAVTDILLTASVERLEKAREIWARVFGVESVAVRRALEDLALLASHPHESL